MEQVGTITQEIIDLLQLHIAPGTPILIGESNIDHIIARHEYEYDKYFSFLPDILAKPDYAGINPKDGSIQYVKEFIVNSEYIRVAVKITQTQRCFVKTLHLLSTYNAEVTIQRLANVLNYRHHKNTGGRRFLLLYRRPFYSALDVVTS